MNKFLKWLKRKDKIISLMIETIISVLIWIEIGLLGQCGFRIEILIISSILILFVCCFPAFMTYFDSNVIEKHIEVLEKRIELLEKNDALGGKNGADPE